jgi:glycosyltransferase involved in cell wall biosynthesis
VLFHWPSARTQRLAGAASPALLREPAVIIPLSARSTQSLGDVPDPAGLRDGTSFLFMGHLSQHKGVADLLAAWAGRPPPAADARLVIAGDGPLRGVVESAAAADPSISYLGYIDTGRKRQALADARWVVFPSRWHENFSITCVEALAAARPILCSQIAQPPMASPGSLVVASDDAAGLGAALGRCAAMPMADYLTHARCARRDGESLLWSRHIQAMQDLLDQAVCETFQHVRDVQRS